MNKTGFWVSIAAVVLGFVGGFFVANSINRTEINRLQAEAESGKGSNNNSADPTNLTLSNEEIQSKIAEADQHPENLAFQKDLGRALYRYASMKNDVSLITEAVRLLDRAAKLSPDDQDITIELGNAWFDIGYFNKDAGALAKARSYYETSLIKRPEDSGVRTDLALTYFLQDPPDDAKAVSEFKKSLANEPKNEKALEFIIQSLARQGDKVEAQKYLDRLRQVNPANSSLDGLAAKLNGQSTGDIK